MAINNPYLPGDPYSYDLKWMIEKLKDIDLNISKEVQAKLDEMDMEGTLQPIIADAVADDVAAQLQSVIDQLQQIGGRHNYILIGDSFGKGVSPGVAEEEWKGWIYWAKQYIETYSESKVYTSLDLIAAGNSGFASSLPFSQHLQYIYENIVPESERSSITDIIVLGGTNDISYAGSVPAAIAAFMASVKIYFPNAKVKIGVVGSSCAALYSTIVPVYSECNKYGAEFIKDTVGLMCLPQYISTDETHLTQAGYIFFSPYVLNAILAGKCNYDFRIIDIPCTLRDSNYINVVSRGAVYASVEVTEKGHTIGFYNKSNNTDSGVQAILMQDFMGSNDENAWAFMYISTTECPRLCKYESRLVTVPEVGISGTTSNVVAIANLAMGGNQSSIPIYRERSAFFFTANPYDYEDHCLRAYIPFVPAFTPY